MGTGGALGKSSDSRWPLVPSGSSIPEASGVVEDR